MSGEYYEQDVIKFQGYKALPNKKECQSLRFLRKKGAFILAWVWKNFECYDVENNEAWYIKSNVILVGI